MAKSNAVHKGNGLLPYPVILSASLGDCVAMDMVLKHYARYINSLCMRTFYDEAGNPHICIDEDMKNRLESKLIAKVLEFEAA